MVSRGDNQNDTTRWHFAHYARC